ncbi:MAG: hypothetical protein KDC67_10350 [Ignavibacteriae bacterium]|nr:hypothetical protein [Ignavibacteriota bacterium]
MDENQLKEILRELAEKSKDYKDGFLAPKECRIKISELNNYDFFIYNELEKTKKELWTRKHSNEKDGEKLLIPVITIDNDYISFIPRIIREYLKEIS